MKKAKIYLGLLHFPMYNKRKDIVATSVTNLDIHDISRVARTYNIDQFFIIHPGLRQQEMVNKIISYWREGYGSTYNEDRSNALEIVKLCSNLEQVKKHIEQETGLKAEVVATDAQLYPETIPYAKLRELIRHEEKAFLLLFGTGWGMTQELVESCDYILPPIGIDSDYNHLSVRSAVAIIVDRLLGEEWYVG